MKKQLTFSRINFVEQAEAIEQILQKAVQRELSIHKQLGNSIAIWKDDQIVIVPPEEIALWDEDGNNSQDVPEYLQILLGRYVDYKDDGIVLANIGIKINAFQGENRHAEAVLTQCRVAWEILNSIQCLVAYDYGLGAMIQCRNLFELVIGTTFLIDRPDKLQDFLDYGKMVAYELAEQVGADQDYLDAFRQKADYDNLKKRYRHIKWHGQTVGKLADHARAKGLYDSFYKESSSIAHADSYVSLGYKSGEWGFSKDVRTWSKYCEMALVFSFMSMAILYHKTVHSLNLPFLGDVQAVMGRLVKKGLID